MGATENDYLALNSVKMSVRIEVMYLYLCDRYKYSMQEIAERILRDNQPQAGKRVSSIMRCYGFNGKGNSGRYASRADRSDIEDFIRKYPNGANDGEFDRFLSQRLQKKQVAAVENQRREAENRRKQEEQQKLRQQAQLEARQRKAALDAEFARKEREQQILQAKQEQERKERLERELAEQKRRQEAYEREQEARRLRQQMLKQSLENARQYANGVNVQKNIPKAAELYEKLLNTLSGISDMESGLSKSEVRDEYGSMLFDCALAQSSKESALSIYLKIPEDCGSYGYAANNIGAIYNNEKSSRYNRQTAFEWFCIAARNGVAKGAKNAGDMLADEDPEAALRYYKQSCRDPNIAAQVQEIIAELELKVKEGELTGVGEFLKTHPEWFQFSAGQFENWEMYAAGTRLNPETLWKKYQETNSKVYERQRFVFFTKKEYMYQGKLELDDFKQSCETEWKRRETVYGTKQYRLSDDEYARAESYHNQGGKWYLEGRYEVAAFHLGLSASAGYEEDRRLLLTLYDEKMKDMKKTVRIAADIADAKSCAVLIRLYMEGKLKKLEDAVWDVAKWLETGGTELWEEDNKLCEAARNFCASQAVGIAARDPDGALELMKQAGAAGGLEYGEVCLKKADQIVGTEEAEAVDYYGKAAENGNTEARRKLGLYWLKTSKVQEGMECLEGLANAGDAESSVYLAEIYLQGKFTARDFGKAVFYYEKSTKPEQFSGYSKAAFQHALQQNEQGNYETAFHYYELLAGYGDISAQNNLGVMYAQGKGMPENKEEAEKWYRMAAEGGNGLAAKNLGCLYRNQKRLEEALHYLEMASAMGQDTQEKIEDIKKRIERRKRHQYLKQVFQDCWENQDYDAGIEALELIHTEFPKDRIYDDMLIACLEEGDETMEKWKKHEELAKHYLRQGYVRLAWEHYQLADELGNLGDSFSAVYLIGDLPKPKGGIQPNCRLRFAALCVELDDVDYETGMELFAVCCSLKQLSEEASAEPDEFGQLKEDGGVSFLLCYRKYWELKIEFAWKHEHYTDCGNALLRRYIVKGRDYHCELELGILNKLDSFELRERIETVIKAWDIYDHFLTWNRTEDPDETSILLGRIRDRDAVIFFTLDQEPAYDEFCQDVRMLMVLLAITREQGIMEELFSISGQETGNVNNGIVDALIFYGSRLWALGSNNGRNLQFYGRAYHPDKLKDWFESGLEEIGLENFRASLQKGVSAAWNRMLNDDDNGNAAYSMEQVVTEEALRCLDGEQQEEEMAALLRMIHLWPCEHYMEEVEEKLMKQLEDTNCHSKIDDASLADIHWSRGEKKMAAYYYGRFLENRKECLSGVELDEMDVLDLPDDKWEETHLEWQCESRYGIASYRLGQVYLLGEDVPKDRERAKFWLERCSEEYGFEQEAKLLLRLCEQPVGKIEPDIEIKSAKAEAEPIVNVDDIDSNQEKMRSLEEGFVRGEKALAIIADGEDSRLAGGGKSFTTAVKWVIERECAQNAQAKDRLENIISLREGKKLPGGLPVRFFSPMLPDEEQKDYTIPPASVKTIQGTDLVMLFHYSSDMLCELLIKVLKYIGADMNRFSLVMDEEK